MTVMYFLLVFLLVFLLGIILGAVSGKLLLDVLRETGNGKQRDAWYPPPVTDPPEPPAPPPRGFWKNPTEPLERPFVPRAKP